MNQVDFPTSEGALFHPNQLANRLTPVIYIHRQGAFPTLIFPPSSSHHHLPTTIFPPSSSQHHLSTVIFPPSSSHHHLPTVIFPPPSSHHHLPTIIFSPSSSHRHFPNIIFPPSSSHRQFPTPIFPPSSSHHHLPTSNQSFFLNLLLPYPLLPPFLPLTFNLKVQCPSQYTTPPPHMTITTNTVCHSQLIHSFIHT